MISDIFAHTIGRVDFIGGVIRIELVNLVPSDAGKPSVQPHHTVIIPVEGLLDATATLQDMVRKLAEAGVLKPQADERPAAEAPKVTAGEPGSPKVSTRSPNFG